MTKDDKTKRPILTLSSFKKTADTDRKQKTQPATKTKSLAATEKKPKANTSSISSTEDNKKSTYEEILAYMRQHYPKCFPPALHSPILLAVRIHEQILAIADKPFSNTSLRNFLARYTRTPEYNKTKRTTKTRYNLDGSIAPQVKDKDKDKGKSKNLPHDGLFKRIMENDIAAREFLEEYLPIDVKAIIDLTTIKVQKESYIEPNLTKRLSDIVYSVNTQDDGEAFIYVIAEHQSSVDPLMAFRLWRYTLLMAEKHINNKEKIPLIFPIVVYAGKAKYTAPRNIWALFERPDLAKELLAEDHALVDLQAMSDDEIAKKKHLALFEYIMKHIRERDMFSLWENLFKKLPDAVILDREHGYFYITNLLWYIDGKLSASKRDELSSLIIEHLPKEGEEIMKTIADSYRDEGITIGKNEGIAIGATSKAIEIARRMLKENTDVKFIASVTGLSKDEILKLQNKL